MKTGPLAEGDGKEMKCLPDCPGICVFRASFVLTADGEVADLCAGQQGCWARRTYRRFFWRERALN